MAKRKTKGGNWEDRLNRGLKIDGRKFEIVREYDEDYKGRKIKYVDVKFEDDEKVYPITKSFYDKYGKKLEKDKSPSIIYLSNDHKIIKNNLGLYEHHTIDDEYGDSITMIKKTKKEIMEFLKLYENKDNIKIFPLDKNGDNFRL